MDDQTPGSSVQTTPQKIIPENFIAEWIASLTDYGSIICPCGQCCYTASSMEDIVNHYNICDSGSLNLYKCPLCGAQTRTKKTLSNHVRRTHYNFGAVISTLRESNVGLIGGIKTEPGLINTEESTTKTVVILQPSPANSKTSELKPISRNAYVRKRAFHKSHITSWNIFLQKDGFIRCHLQGCRFIAQSIDEMKGHFGYCTGQNSDTAYECPFCKGQTTTAELLNAHIQRSHIVSDSIVTTVVEAQPDLISDDGIPDLSDKNTVNMKLLLVGWRSKGYVRCPFDCNTILKKLFPLVLHLSSCKKAPASFCAVCVCGFTSRSSLTFLHHTKSCDAIVFHVKNVNTYNFDFQIAEEVLNAWSTLIEEEGFVRCNRCACLTFDVCDAANHYSVCLQEAATAEKFDCTFCTGWAKSFVDLIRHVFFSHSTSSEYALAIRPEIVKPIISVENTFFKINDEYICQYCEKRFEEERGIQYHMRNEHKYIMQEKNSCSLVEFWKSEIVMHSLCSCQKYPCSFATDTIVEMLRHYEQCMGPDQQFDNVDKNQTSPSEKQNRNVEDVTITRKDPGDPQSDDAPDISQNANQGSIELNDNIANSSTQTARKKGKKSRSSNGSIDLPEQSHEVSEKFLVQMNEALKKNVEKASQLKNSASRTGASTSLIPMYPMKKSRSSNSSTDLPEQSPVVSEKFFRKVNEALRKTAVKASQLNNSAALIPECILETTEVTLTLAGAQQTTQNNIIDRTPKVENITDDRKVYCVKKSVKTIPKNVSKHVVPSFEACRDQWSQLSGSKQNKQASQIKQEVGCAEPRCSVSPCQTDNDLTETEVVAPRDNEAIVKTEYVFPDGSSCEMLEVDSAPDLLVSEEVVLTENCIESNDNFLAYGTTTHTEEMNNTEDPNDNSPGGSDNEAADVYHDDTVDQGSDSDLEENCDAPPCLPFRTSPHLFTVSDGHRESFASETKSNQSTGISNKRVTGERNQCPENDNDNQLIIPYHVDKADSPKDGSALSFGESEKLLHQETDVVTGEYQVECSAEGYLVLKPVAVDDLSIETDSEGTISIEEKVQKYSPSDIVTCGVCDKKMEYSVYEEEHKEIHHGLSWIEGDTSTNYVSNELCASSRKDSQSSFQKQEESKTHRFVRDVECLDQINEEENLKPVKNSTQKNESGFKFLRSNSCEKENWSEEIRSSLETEVKHDDLQSSKKISRKRKYLPSDIVKCGLCKEEMMYDFYVKKHQEKHFKLCWIEGETPLDFFDEKRCMSTLMKYQSIFTKSKKKTSPKCFSCFKCKESHKSAPSHLRHLIVCVVKNEFKNKRHTSAKAESMLNPGSQSRIDFEAKNNTVYQEGGDAGESSMSVIIGDKIDCAPQENDSQNSPEQNKVDKKSVLPSIPVENEPNFTVSCELPAGNPQPGDNTVANVSPIAASEQNVEITDSSAASSKACASKRFPCSRSRKQELTERNHEDLTQPVEVCSSVSETIQSVNLQLGEASEGNVVINRKATKISCSRNTIRRGRRKSKALRVAKKVAIDEDTRDISPQSSNCDNGSRIISVSTDGEINEGGKVSGTSSLENSVCGNYETPSSAMAEKIDLNSFVSNSSGLLENECENLENNQILNESSLEISDSLSKKSGRERPKKKQVEENIEREPCSVQSKKNAVELGVIETNADNLTNLKKAGRGRPKKISVLKKDGPSEDDKLLEGTSSLDVPSSDEPESKKMSLESSDGNHTNLSEVTELPIKKAGRGRPKKKLSIETSESETKTSVKSSNELGADEYSTPSQEQRLIVDSAADNLAEISETPIQKVGRGRPKKNFSVDKVEEDTGESFKICPSSSTDIDTVTSSPQIDAQMKKAGRGRSKIRLSTENAGSRCESIESSDLSQAKLLNVPSAHDAKHLPEISDVQNAGRGRPKKKIFAKNTEKEPINDVLDKTSSQVDRRLSREKISHQDSETTDVRRPSRRKSNLVIEENQVEIVLPSRKASLDRRKTSLDTDEVSNSPRSVQPETKKAIGRPKKSCVVENEKSVRTDADTSTTNNCEEVKRRSVRSKKSIDEMEVKKCEVKDITSTTKGTTVISNEADEISENSPKTFDLQKKRGRGRPKLNPTNEKVAVEDGTPSRGSVSAGKDESLVMFTSLEKDEEGSTLLESSSHKRGRGRSAKKSLKVDDEQLTEDILLMKERSAPIKRKTSIDSEISCDSAASLRNNIGRGRGKRKSIKEMEDDTRDVPIKKSRGRPPKTKICENLLEEEAESFQSTSKRLSSRNKVDDKSVNQASGRRKSGRVRSEKSLAISDISDESEDDTVREVVRKKSGRKSKLAVVDTSEESDAETFVKSSSSKISTRGRKVKKSYHGEFKGTVEKADILETSCTDEAKKNKKSNDLFQDAPENYEEEKDEEEEPMKRQKLTVSDDGMDSKYQLSDTVKCGVCEEEMTYDVYRVRHREKHFKLCWINGETPIDLFDDEITKNILTRYQSQIIKLKKKGINKLFRCYKCGDAHKSSVGHLSHIRSCVAKDEDRHKAMVACDHCGSFLLRSSMKSHLKACIFAVKKTVAPHEPLVILGKSKRSAAMRAESDIKRLSANLMDTKDDIKVEPTSDEGEDADFKAEENEDEYENENDNEEMGEEEKVDWKSPRSLPYHQKTKGRIFSATMRFLERAVANGGEGSCPYPGCSFKTDQLEALKSHYHNCPIANQNKYSCYECPFKTEFVDEIEAHVQTVHKRVIRRSVNWPSEQTDQSYLRLYPQPDDSRFSDSRIDKLGFTYKWTLSFVQEKLCTIPSFAFLETSSELSVVSDKMLDEFLPTCRESISVFSSKAEASQFKLFQSENEDSFIKIFIGGPIWSLAWAPTSVKQTRQFLAVSTHLSMDAVYIRENNSCHPGLIQFWEFPRLSNLDKKADDPRLVFGIAHEYGTAWSMEWCPSATMPDERLGVLAVGFSSGVVAIYSIPHPEHLSDLEARYPVYNLKPCITLDLQVGDQGQCTKVSWQRVQPHNIFAAGYTSGFVGVWDLNTTSPLLKEGNVLFPYLVFQPHLSPIVGLQLGAFGENRYLATAASDRVGACCWDLKDVAFPVSHIQRNKGRNNITMTDLVWPNHWLALITASDDAFCQGASAQLNALREFNYIVESLLPQTANNWCLSYSEWTGSIVVSSNDGNVSMIAPGQLLRLVDQRHRNLKRRIIKTIVVDKNTGMPIEKKTKAKVKARPFQPRPLVYSEAAENFALKFVQTMEPQQLRSDRQMPSNEVNFYPLNSINKVAWNPNCQSFLWLTMGYQSGFLCLSRKDIILKSVLENYYAQL